MEAMKQQFIALMAYLQNLPVTIISIDNVEADDVIAYIAKNILPEKQTIICSTDKDFIHLVDDNIKVWSPTKKQLIDKDWVLNKFGIHSDNFIYSRVFEGDKSDNITGVNGVGLKTMIKRIPIITDSTQLQLQDIFDYCKTQLDEGSKIKLYSTILENKDIAIRNEKLMCLKDVDISATIKMSVKEQFDAPVPKYDITTFKRRFISDKLYHGIPNIDNWLQNTFNHLSTFIGK